MRIDYLFSSNNKIGSKIIRYASWYVETKKQIDIKEIPSHAAVLIDNTYVIESTMLNGVRIIPFNKWLEHNKIVKRIAARRFVEHPKDLMFEMWGKRYDYKGLLYFACCMLKNDLTTHNKWEQEEAFFCTEFVSRIYDGNTGSMRSPYKLMELINNG